jgi:hypothetical protein
MGLSLLNKLMKVFKITEDVNNYQWIMPEDDSDILNTLKFECSPRSQNWSPINMYVFNPKKKKGNFFSLGGFGALVFDEIVLDKMLTFLEMAGEILPLNVEGTTLYCLNVLECVNSLDQNKTVWDHYDDGTKGRILKYAFHSNRTTNSSIFKIPETCRTEVLVYSGVKDEEDEFYSSYKKCGFTGLDFTEIYSTG